MRKKIFGIWKSHKSHSFENPLRGKNNWQSRANQTESDLSGLDWFQYLVLLRSLFVGWFSILSHFSNRIYLSALRVTACLFSVEIIPIDTKKRKMPESFSFYVADRELGEGWGGSSGHSGGGNDETESQPQLSPQKF